MLELNDNQYEVQGIALTELASRYELPLYVYDADTMKRQYDSLTSAFGVFTMKIKYACKALNNLSVLSLFRSWGSGLDTVSIQEVELGLMAGFAPQDIIFTPNCVSFEEIAQAVTKGVVINIDNLSILEQFGNTFGGSYPCCVRINPHILAGGNYHLQTGHIDSKFGISVYQLRHLLRIVKTYSMNITGLHMHSGSDILDAGVFLQGAEIYSMQQRTSRICSLSTSVAALRLPTKMMM